MSKTKSLRESMPTVSAWIDDLRAAFGADCINASIRNGMAGGTDFYAEEGGQAIGCVATPCGHVVCMGDMVLAKPEKEDDGRPR